MLDDQVGRTIAAGDGCMASSERLCECTLLNISHESAKRDQQIRRIMLHGFGQMSQSIVLSVRCERESEPKV